MIPDRLPPNDPNAPLPSGTRSSRSQVPGKEMPEPILQSILQNYDSLGERIPNRTTDQQLYSLVPNDRELAKKVRDLAAERGITKLVEWDGLTNTDLPWTQKTLVAAAKGGQIELLKTLLERGVPFSEAILDVVPPEKLPALLEIVDKLTFEDIDHTHQLQKAIETGNLTRAKWAFGKGGDIKQVPENLIYDFKNKNLDFMKWLAGNVMLDEHKTSEAARRYPDIQAWADKALRNLESEEEEEGRPWER